MLIIFLGEISKEEKDLVSKIFVKLYKKMYCIGYLILNNQADAEEAVSESFYKIIKKVKMFSSLSCHEIEAYCVKIVKNEAINIIRKNKKFIAIEDIDYIQDV